MPSSVNMHDAGLYYRVKHPEFDQGLAYRLVVLTRYDESAWAYATFINERGMTYGVQIKHARFIGYCRGRDHANGGWLFELTGVGSHIGGPMFVPLTEEQQQIPWPKPIVANPDLDDLNG